MGSSRRRPKNYTKPLFPYYAPENYQKPFSFLMMSRGNEMKTLGRIPLKLHNSFLRNLDKRLFL